MNHSDHPTQTRSWGLGKTFSVILSLLLGLYLLGGGIYLLSLGGSAYYAAGGVVFLAIAVLLWRDHPFSLWLYVLFLLGTTIWGLHEVGSDFWSLAPRYDVHFLLGLWLLLPISAPQLRGRSAAWARRCIVLILLLILVIMSYSFFNDPQEISGSLPARQAVSQSAAAPESDADWPAYGRTQNGLRYSPLAQINQNNVQHLEQAWIYHTEDLKTGKDPQESTYEVTPIKVADKLFVCTMHQFLDALDPATGKRLWRYDPHLVVNDKSYHLACRGVSYYDASRQLTGGAERSAPSTDHGAQAAASSASGQCIRKILLPVNDGRLAAINADNGQPCTEFGDNGVVDLLERQPYASSMDYNPSSPPVITHHTIVIGGSVTDNLSDRQPSGVIRGYDVMTGKLKWAFDTGAEDPNALPSGHDKFVHNSPNSWAPMAYDADSNTVFVPTGVGSPDIWGGNRSKPAETWANSMLALDADTGKLKWHFQTTHHDLWDMDVPAQPSLVDLKKPDGQVVPAIYVLTKTGNVFVLDRRTGQPIVPVHEKPVPQSVKRGPAARGEHYAATQPFSDLNMAPQEKLTDRDMWGATMLDQLICRIQFKRLNYDGIYTPPSENGTLVFPGNLGVFEWGGMSVNPQRQVAFMNLMGVPFLSRLKPEDPDRERVIAGDKTESGAHPMYGTPYSVQLEPFLSPIGIPCKQPAWGFVAAVDLSNHQVVWKKRLGTIRDSVSNTLQLPPLTIGMPSLGAPITTAGNLMFIAASQDRYLRAYDTENGKKLWEARLPAGGQATPMTYEINGRQYVVIMAGGHGGMGTKEGDSLVAFALPEQQLDQKAKR